MEEGLLSLKWNNHKSTFFQVLSALRQKLTFTDVTVACEGRLYPAHKFVLSACSEYFSEVFGSISGTNLVVVLKDVRQADLEYLLDYMYLGQVDVAQSELASLIKTAECLRIKGLAIPDDELNKIRVREADDQRDGSPPAKKKRHLTVEEDRGSGNNLSLACRAQQDLLPPPPELNSLSQQPRPAAPLATPTTLSRPSSPKAPTKSQPTSLPIPQTSAPSQGATHTPSAPAPPLPVIKQEAADPADSADTFEGYEDNETKPDVTDEVIPGPSGLQRPSDTWEGDNDVGGFAGGGGGGGGWGAESYTDTVMEESGDSEVHGGHGACDGPLGSDAEEFLRRLEDKPRSQDPFPVHRPPSGNLTSTSFSSSQHLFSGPVTNNEQILRFPNPKPPLYSTSCSFGSRSLGDLMTHKQLVHRKQSSRVLPPLQPMPNVYVMTAEERKQKIYKCPYCEVQVKGQSAIQTHVANHHAAKEEGLDRPYWCSFCTLKCRSAPGLSSHLKRHKTQGDC